MADSELLARAKTLLDHLSETPRFAGSPAEDKARARCMELLDRSGFSCREVPFEYSQWPGRWGPPLATAIHAATILLVARMAVHEGPLVALAVGAGLFGALTIATGDARRRWTTDLAWQRARSVNLEARRGNPRVWLVAHIDSKSQTVPMLIRIASSIALAVVTGLVLLLLFLSLVGAPGIRAAWPGLGMAAVVVGLPSMFCFVRNESRGAVDNASGVAAVLLAAQLRSSPQDIGVLITSGEELGLAGARAWAPTASPEMFVVNCDTIDDAGRWRCMYTSPRPATLAAAAKGSALKLGLDMTAGRLIPGILADSMVFADRGIESVTISRGTLSTLARIHTRRDNSIALRGSGVAEAGELLSSLAKDLA